MRKPSRIRNNLLLTLLLLLFLVVLPISYFKVQDQHAEFALEVVQRQLRVPSSPLSHSLVEDVGAFQDVTIEGSYAHVHWRKAMVDGVLTAGTRRYWFRCIVKNGEPKLEAILEMKGIVEQNSASE